MASDEQTPLRLSEPERSYVYMSARNRTYRSKVRQFQCCVCAALLGAFVIAMVITVSYMVDHDVEDETNSTEITSPLPPPVQQQQDLQNLLTSVWPKPFWSYQFPKVLWATADGVGSDDAALKDGAAFLAAQDQAELDNPPVPLPPHHPSSYHRAAMASSPEAGQAARVGQLLLLATKSAYKSGGWSSGTYGHRLPPSSWIPEKWCPAQVAPKCYHTPYRTIDGSCNNLVNPDFGRAMTPFKRGLPADYGDGISSPRRAKDGSELPAARDVSLSVHRPMYRNDPHFTVMLAVWGQFVDHDFTATALSQRKDGSAITCCNAVWQHPECFPVKVTPSDPFYAENNITCLDFVRSAPAPTCHLGPREQLNQVTPFIDGSVVYGANDELASQLRTFEGGRLASSQSPDGRELLPEDKMPGGACNQDKEKARGRYCFKSGDARANENLHLTTLHLIMQREHNRLVTLFSEKNPSWDDETLYQEARRIVGAQLQHVTFNEFLPIILGEELSESLELRPKETGYYYGYDPNVDIQIANEFASSAFRFGHTLLQGLMKVIGSDNSSVDYVEMHKMLFNPFGLYDKGYMASALRGALRTDVQKADQYFSTEVSQKLFQKKSQGPCGLDLVSLNIQRGRDHALPGYPAWRERCGLSRPLTFADLEAIMDPDTVALLQELYHDVNDIDAYTGFVSESPMTDTLLGPTAICIISDQFVRFKKGDRFWYETPEKPQAFTPKQLDELRKVTLSSLLCDNTDSLEEVQPYAMRSITPENPLMPCKDLVRPDYSVWTELPHINLGESPMKPVPTAEEHYSKKHKDDKDPFEPFEKVSASSGGNLIISATVIGGNITGSYDVNDLFTLWNGGFPVEIKAPFFDNVTKPIPFQMPTPKVVEYRGGFLWGGHVEKLLNGNLYISANYHLPITPPNLGPKIVREWWCGEAEIEAKINWSTGDIYELPENNYFSPAYFKQEKGAPSKKLFSDGTASRMLQARVDRDPLDPSSLPRIPIYISGQYNDDNSAFWWNGDVTIILPKTPPMVDTTNLQLSALKEPSSNKLAYVFGGTVKSGSIVSSVGQFWDGTVPFDISTIAPKPFAKDLIHGGFAMVTGKFTSGTPDTLQFTGDFSVPVSDGTNPGVVEWQKGTITTSITIQWNSSLTPLLETSTYNFAIYLRDNAKTTNTIDTMDEAKNLLALTPGAPDMFTQGLLILHGIYKTKDIFTWSGELELAIIPTPENLLTKSVPNKKLIKMSKNNLKEDALEPRTDEINYIERFYVFGGHATSGVIFNNETNYWGGSIPFEIDIPMQNMKDDVHDGSVLIRSVVHGKFYNQSGGTSLKFIGSVAIALTHPDTGVVKWKESSIITNIAVDWTSDYMSLVTSIDTWHLLIYLREKPKEKVVLDVEELLGGLPKASQNFTPALIILDGYYVGKNGFTWTGRIDFAILSSVLDKPKPVSLQLAAPKTKELIIGATITSGTVFGSGSYSNGPLEALWSDGTFPRAISTLYLRAPDGSLKPPKTIEYIGGAIWDGSIQMSSPSTLHMVANYYLPLVNDTWWCGQFDLELKVNWNTTELNDIPHDNFYSPIGFKLDSKDKKENAFMSLFAPDQGVHQLKAESAPLDKNTLSRFPILFHGTYNSDNSQFLFNGQLTLVFPKKTPPLLTAEEPIPAPAIPQGKAVFGGTVTSGSLELSDGTEWVNVKFPIDVPYKAYGKDFLHGGNAIFTGEFHYPSNIVYFTGNFSAPTSSPTNPGVVTWVDGKLKTIVNVTWGEDSRVFIPRGEVTMFGMVFMTESKKDTATLPPEGHLLTASNNNPSMYPTLILILHGKHDKTTKVFSWNGDVTVIVKPATPIKPLLGAPFSPPRPRRLVLGGTVESGKVTGYNGGVPKKVWFDGSLPMAIPMPAFDRYMGPGQPAPGPEPTGPIFHGHGILWTGSVTPREGTKQVEIYGEFRLPVYEHDTTFSQEWWLGHVELVVNVNWNSTNLYAVNSEDGQQDFFSPIRFRPDEPNFTNNDLSSVQKCDPDMMHVTPVKASTASPYFPKGYMPRFPIILHGHMNEDRSAFLWSGNMTMVYPF